MNPNEKKERVDLNLINYKLGELQSDFKDLKSQISTDSSTRVTRVEFELRVGRLEKIVYSMVAFILMAVLSAVVYGVVKQQ